MVNVADLSDVAYTAVEVIGEEFKKRNIGTPVEDVEFLALVFDPRTKDFGKSVCGGEEGKQKALAALSGVSIHLIDTVEAVGAVGVQAPPAATPPPEKRARVATTAYERRQARKEKEAAAARTSARRDEPSVTDRSEKEVDEYSKLPAAVPAKDYDVLGFWQDAGSPRLDAHGNVVSAAQFPILSMLARVYLCIDSTSCQSERDFSGLGFVYNNFRQAMMPDRVEMVMFLRSNPHIIPEVMKLDNELGKLLAAQSVGKAKAASVQAACAGKQVVVEVESD